MRLRSLVRFAHLPAALVAGACTSPATEVLVRIDSDAPTDRALTIHATLHAGTALAGDGGGMHTWTRGGPGGTATLPATFAVTPGDGAPRDELVTLVVDAMLAADASGAPSVAFRRIARFTFTPHATTELSLFLAIGCTAPSTGCLDASQPCTVAQRCEDLQQTCGDEATCVGTTVVPSPPGMLDVAQPPLDAERDVAMDRAIDAPVDAPEDVPEDIPQDAPRDVPQDVQPTLPVPCTTVVVDALVSICNGGGHTLLVSDPDFPDGGAPNSWGYQACSGACGVPAGGVAWSMTGTSIDEARVLCHSTLPGALGRPPASEPFTGAVTDATCLCDELLVGLRPVRAASGVLTALGPVCASHGTGAITVRGGGGGAVVAGDLVCPAGLHVVRIAYRDRVGTDAAEGLRVYCDAAP